MRVISDKYLLAIALLGFYFLWAFFEPMLGYLLDSDATAYLTIAKRVANGQWFESVNGLWSPLNSWLLVPFIKIGFSPWAAAKGLNAFFAGVLLVQVFYFFKQFNFPRFYFLIVFLVFIPILVFYSFFQIFGDVLQLILSMGYVQLFCKKDFMKRTRLVVLAAVLMGVGYYAKSYSLVFFILHFSLLSLFALRQKGWDLKLVLNYVLGIGLVVVIALPWSLQLQKKYSEFSLTGNAGKLNMSWYINSSKTFNDTIDLIIPPPYKDAPSFWEDPYLSKGNLSTPFSSFHHFKRWVLRVGHTVLMAVKSFSEISIFYILVFLIFLWFLKKKRKIPSPFLSLFLAAFILPLGYLAMHIETRYIWLCTFLLPPLFYFLFIKNKGFKKGIVILFAVSMLLHPVYMMLALKDKNKELFVIANDFKKLHLGSDRKVVTNKDDEGSFWVVSYLAELNNYTIEQDQFPLNKMIIEMRRYNLKYYLHFDHQKDQISEIDPLFKTNFKPSMVLEQSGLVLWKLKD